MTSSTKSSPRRLIARIIVVGAVAAMPLGLAAAPAIASGNHSASCNFDGNVQWADYCPGD